MSSKSYRNCEWKPVVSPSPIKPGIEITEPLVPALVQQKSLKQPSYSNPHSPSHLLATAALTAGKKVRHSITPPHHDWQRPTQTLALLLCSARLLLSPFSPLIFSPSHPLTFSTVVISLLSFHQFPKYPIDCVKDKKINMFARAIFARTPLRFTPTACSCRAYASAATDEPKRSNALVYSAIVGIAAGAGYYYYYTTVGEKDKVALGPPEITLKGDGEWVDLKVCCLLCSFSMRDVVEWGDWKRC